MSDFLYVNGAIVPREEARLSPLDRGFLYGDGFFETLRLVGGTPFRLARHLQRLNSSCRETGWGREISPEEVESAVAALVQRNGVADGYLRITASRGLHTGALAVLEAREPTLVIEARPMDLPPLEGPPAFALARASFRRDETCPIWRHKSLSYLSNVLALAEARRRGADEVYFLNSRGHLAEGAITNIFLVRGGTLHTPEVACGLLPGITREIVMELCAASGIRCQTGRYEESALAEAEEVFCTNSLRGIIPVKAILEMPDRHFGENAVTRRLHGLYAALVRAECAAGK